MKLGPEYEVTIILILWLSKTLGSPKMLSSFVITLILQTW